MNYSDEEREKLAKENIGLVYFTLKKMHLLYRKDDLFDVGLIGLTDAINNFDENRGVKLSSFMYQCIKNRIRQFITMENTLKRQAEIISLNTIIGDDGEIELQDLIGYDPNYDEEIIKKEMLEKINKRLSLLPKKQIEIFNYSYGLNGYPKLEYKEIAKKTNTSESYIFNVKSKVINKLKYYLKDYK